MDNIPSMATPKTINSFALIVSFSNIWFLYNPINTYIIMKILYKKN